MAPARVSYWTIHIAAYAALTLPVAGQAVISTHSGLIHYFDGAVYLGDQALEAHLGKFPSIPQGAELRTVDGRAEVLLTPGVFLRVGDHTAIRMVATALTDTQVELESGSIAVESGPPNLNTSITLLYKVWRVHLLEQGVYRIDSNPPRLWAGEGSAEVFSAPGMDPVRVERGMSLPFADVLVPEPQTEPPHDALMKWMAGRDESISADNAITDQLNEDLSLGLSGLNGFTYFPVLGVPPPGVTSTSPYGTYPTVQPGFSSIYLPGYTYRPMLMGIIGVGYGPLGLGRTSLTPGAPFGRNGIIVIGNPAIGLPTGRLPIGLGTPGIGVGFPARTFPPYSTSLPRGEFSPGAGVSVPRAPMLGTPTPHPGGATVRVAPPSAPAVRGPVHR